MQTTQEIRKEFEPLISIINEMDRLDPFITQKKSDIQKLEITLQQLNTNKDNLIVRIQELKTEEVKMEIGSIVMLENIDKQISLQSDLTSLTNSINKLTTKLLTYKKYLGKFIEKINSLKDMIKD
jgi:predicted RNase H-like nuclease (RuvC/YqgF family)